MGKTYAYATSTFNKDLIYCIYTNTKGRIYMDDKKDTAIAKVLETIKKYNMISYGDRVLVGFSGGPDSLCLLHILYRLKRALGISLAAVHLNHMIRDEEAIRDERFSKEFAESINIPFYSKRVPVEDLAKEMRISTEEAGRIVRYGFFDEVCKLEGTNKIALAHNMNDQAETMIMRFFRGTGVSGLGGINPIREDKYIRPVIGLSRDEIEEYCLNNSLNPVRDSTNEKSLYTRNRIRLELIPYIMKNLNPNIIESLYKTSEIIREEDSYLNKTAKGYIKDLKFKDGLLIEKFNCLDLAVKRRIMRILINEIRGDIVGIEGIHIEECVLLILKGETGKRVNLPGDIQCVIEYDIFKIERETEKKYYNYPLPLPGGINIKEIGISISTKILEKNNSNFRDNDFVKYFDYDKIKGELSVRNRRDGDYIYPKGMRGRKKFKDILIDKKIPRDKRDDIPLIAIEGEIIWAIGFRDTNNYNIDERTKKILEIKITRGV